MLTKTCTKCGNERPADAANFRLHKGSRDGFNTQCRACEVEYARAWNKSHPDNRKINKSKFNRLHKDEINAYLVEWRKKHPGYSTVESKTWYHANLNKARAGRRAIAKRQRATVQGRLHTNVSRGIHHMLREFKAGKHWPDILGYTAEQLKQHLESKFLPGMSWENYGMHGWHIDHVTPKEFFEFNNMNDVEFQYCWSLDNLQPLWAVDNIRKGNKIEWAAA